MLYEMRTYTAMAGRLPDLNKRFAEITLGFGRTSWAGPRTS